MFKLLVLTTLLYLTSSRPASKRHQLDSLTGSDDTNFLPHTVEDDTNFLPLSGPDDNSLPCCESSKRSKYNAMARLSHRYAYELIGDHARQNDNLDVALSPYSIISVLQALSLGTRGTTKLEIDSQLQYSTNENHAIMKCSLDSFQKESNVTVLVASRLFAEEYLMNCLDPVFAKELKFYYGSDVEGVQFTRDPVRAWGRINKFVEDKTNGIVADFMQRYDQTQVMYVNTIVFKGQWKQQFNKSMTRRGSFYPSPQRQINLPMMTVDGIFRSITLSKYRYYGDNLKVVELPYSDEKYNMYIFMAERGKLDLSFMESIINDMTVPAFKSDHLEYQERPLRVVLPKFKISSEIDISRALYNMGIKKLFTPNADLSGIFSDYPVHFNKMFHKSVIEVTEEGTVAAGATASILVRSGYEQEEFIVNRPFVYVIHDSCNNMVLFQGRYYGNLGT